jgi:YVTN family beta-propeller protein
LIAIGCTLVVSSAEVAAVDAGPAAMTQPAPENHAKRSSSAIAITADGLTLLIVNPDSDSLSIVDLEGALKVTEIAVGSDPRTVAVSDDGARAYVANRAGHSVSVVDLHSRAVMAEVPLAARPYGLVVGPDGQTLYVAEQGGDRLTILDTTHFTRIASLPVADRPSGLAISADGRSLYITHLLRRAITKLDLPLTQIYFPLVAGASNANDQGNAISAVATDIDLWPNSNLVQSFVIDPDEQRAYVPHTRANSSNPALGLDSTVFPVVSVVDLATDRHMVGEQFNLEILDPPAVGLPFDAVLAPDGSELWVVNAASNDVTVIDLVTGKRAAHIEVGANPRGIVFRPDGSQAYVNNVLDGTVSFLDGSSYTVTQVLPVTTIPLNPVLLMGKKLFNSSDDPRMGQDQWLSCNTCHFDGEMDGQTWLLGFAGPRNTSSLLGMSETLPLRWSGEWDEAADSEFAIRMDSFGTGLIAGAMNCSLAPPDCVNHPPHANLSADLDALAAYLNSLSIPPGRPLSGAASRGQAHFNDPGVGCAGCHPAPLYTDNLTHDVGTVSGKEQIGPAFNTPSLRGVYDTGPYFHDGSAISLLETITRPGGNGEHDVTANLDASEIDDLLAFLLSLNR